MNGIEVPPTLRMLAAILDHVEVCLSESGCPLTDAQSAVFDEARSAALEQAISLEVSA